MQKRPQISLEIIGKKDTPKKSRTRLNIITFLGFLQYPSHPVTVVCTLMGTLQIGTANG